MVNFVEYFTEVEEYGVCLSFVVERLGEVSGCCDELGFAISSLSKSVLEGGDEVIDV